MSYRPNIWKYKIATMPITVNAHVMVFQIGYLHYMASAETGNSVSHTISSAAHISRVNINTWTDYSTEYNQV